ncbi:UNVERIFIED_CONTAM: hypothetical protein RMT77_019701 [Armadillidium vulgare]
MNGKKIRCTCTRAEYLLDIQMKGPKMIKPKKRMKGINVKFATGISVGHNVLVECGVIIGWDENYELLSDTEKARDFSSLKYKGDQPFYNILLSDGSRCYAAQENLVLDEEPLLVWNSDVWKYFREFNNVFYIPNEELCSEYPDDERIRLELTKL